MKRGHEETEEASSKKSAMPRRPGQIAVALSSPEYVAALQQEAAAYAVVHGIIVAKPGTKGAVVHAPLALLPFELDAGAFYQAQNMSPLFNKLVDQISRRPEFLLKQLSGVAHADEFTGRLVKLLESIEKSGGSKQKLHLNINRSDYMIHNTQDEKGNVVQIPQQVELNTIAASFAALSTRVAQMHRFFLERYDGKAQLSAMNLPENNCVQELAAGMAHAVHLYRGSFTNPVVMCIVLPNETNIADQRILEYTLWEHHRVRMIRRSLQEVSERAALSAEGELSMDGEGVALVYFRAGYDPHHYPSEKEWQGLETLEKSMAIKCPCVASHLAGCKKIQQLMALPGVLEQFLSEQEALHLRSCFTGLWGLDKDDDETKAVIADALAHPENYVLKPQREGGGNNLWFKEMTDKLSSASLEERSAFILMQRIKPRPAVSPMMREGELTVGDCLSELGIFGVLVSDGEQVHRNKCCGHLLRTKREGVDEGGVAAGFAVLSSPLLTSDSADA